MRLVIEHIYVVKLWQLGKQRKEGMEMVVLCIIPANVL